MKLEFGSRAPLLARVERVTCPGLTAPVRLLYASDLHLTANRKHLVAALCRSVVEAAPDAVLLGGDLVDRRNGVAVLDAAVRSIAPHAQVMVVPGNHDAWVGARSVRDTVVRAGGVWLMDAPVTIGGVVVCGSPAQRDAAFVQVLCGHHPDVFPKARRSGFDLVLAGHLHGGQVVLWQRGTRLYPGAFVYRYNGLRFADGGTTMIVSRGVADTLPVRFNCPREVIVTDLVP